MHLAPMRDGDASQHVVRAASEPPQHPLRVAGVNGLAEHFVLEHHRRVGANDDSRRPPRGASARLLAREALDVGGRRLAVMLRLIDDGCDDLERESGGLEEFPAARRGRSEQQLHVAAAYVRTVTRAQASPRGESLTRSAGITGMA